jgi:phosphoribosylformylglycinamidine synthase
VPKVTDDSVKVVETLINVVRGGDVVSAHDVSAGGLVVALSEMCDSMGADIDLTAVGDNLRADDILFSESHARAILVTSSPEKVTEMLVDVPHTVIGTVGGKNLSIKGDGFDISLSLEEISDARASLTKLMME